MLMDWEKAGNQEFEIYPEGSYCVEIKSWKKEIAKSSGNEMIRLDGAIVTPSAHKGKSVVEWITLTEAAQWRLAFFLEKCLAIDVKKLPPMDTDSEEFRNLLNACKGRKMFWNIYIDSYDGKNKNKTTQKDPYEISKGNQPFDISTIEEAPDWVKSRK